MAIKNKKTMATSVPCRKTGDSMVHAQASILDSAGSMDDSSLKELLDQTRQDSLSLLVASNGVVPSYKYTVAHIASELYYTAAVKLARLVSSNCL